MSFGARSVTPLLLVSVQVTSTGWPRATFDASLVTSSESSPGAKSKRSLACGAPVGNQLAKGHPPGRITGSGMLLASAGFAVAAGLGLAALARRWPSRRGMVYTAAAAVMLLELWPHTWPQTALPHVPEFYRQMAAGRFPRGPVLDLPHGWQNRSDRASAYMYYQTIHEQPIAWSYLSRYHKIFPNDGLEPLWNLQLPADARLRARIKALGFRYIVWHKYSGMFVGGQVSTGMLAQPWGPPTPLTSHKLFTDAYAGETPIYEDPLVIVFAVR